MVLKSENLSRKKQDKVLVGVLKKQQQNHIEDKAVQNVDNDNIIVEVEFDYPTIEGMIYKGTKVKVSESDYNQKKYDEKIRGKSDVGKIVWVPRKLLRRIT